jgi:hypothetical protein
MRIDPDACRDPDLLADEVRRLRAVIESGKPVLTDAERQAIRFAIVLNDESGIPDDAATLRGLLDRTQTGEK